MTIKQLFKKLFLLILKGYGNTKIYFDSETACFDSHYIPINDCSFDSFVDGDHCILHWDSTKEKHIRYIHQIESILDDLQNIKHNEYILCSAVWYKDLLLKKPEVLKIRGFSPFNVDKGIVFCGWRHTNCIYQMVAITGLKSIPSEAGEEVQGFLTSKNRFVDRKEAGEIAFKAKQINKEIDFLFSEDLY